MSQITHTNKMPDRPPIKSEFQQPTQTKKDLEGLRNRLEILQQDLLKTRQEMKSFAQNGTEVPDLAEIKGTLQAMLEAQEIFEKEMNDLKGLFTKLTQTVETVAETVDKLSKKK